MKSRTVGIQRTPQGLLITDLNDLARRAALFASLDGSCPDFPEIPANTTEFERVPGLAVANWEAG